MTDQQQLDRLLTSFFAMGTDELADRVIDAALDQIDHTPQRHALRMPWRFSAMTMTTRLAAAAVIGVIAVGGALYLLKPNQPAVGSPSPTPRRDLQPVAVATPGRPTAAPTPTPDRSGPDRSTRGRAANPYRHGPGRRPRLRRRRARLRRPPQSLRPRSMTRRPAGSPRLAPWAPPAPRPPPPGSPTAAS